MLHVPVNSIVTIENVNVEGNTFEKKPTASFQTATNAVIGKKCLH